jgi:hypothetical protein
MKPAEHNSFEVFKERGIWLRYFLEPIILQADDLDPAEEIRL